MLALHALFRILRQLQLVSHLLGKLLQPEAPFRKCHTSQRVHGRTSPMILRHGICTSCCKHPKMPSNLGNVWRVLLYRLGHQGCQGARHLSGQASAGTRPGQLQNHRAGAADGHGTTQIFEPRHVPLQGYSYARKGQFLGLGQLAQTRDPLPYQTWHCRIAMRTIHL